MRSALLAVILGSRALAQDWPVYGHDAGGTRFSPLRQINKANVASLKPAWTFRTGSLEPASPMNRKAAFEATPILVGGTLYVSTPYSQVFALDPVTGEKRWVYDPEIDRRAERSEVTSRGVTHSQGRIFLATIDARLIALDALTSALITDFGNKGVVDLTQGIEVKDRGDYQVTSPPVAVSGLIIVGSSIGDNGRCDRESGVVRAFDARSGVQRWAWDPLPKDLRSGAANAWAPMSADPDRDLVFVPTSSPSPDFYGGLRLGDNAHANSVVVLKGSTGKLVWSFQVVHHDLWDYDVASQPLLFDTRLNGRNVPAVAVNTKMGHLFVLDRVTGKPLWPVEERAVPKSDVPGEEAAKTQPFPRDSALVSDRFEVWGATEEDRHYCAELVRNARSEGIFTPPSVRGSVLFPGNVGGVNWGGAAYDPRLGLLFTATNHVATIMRLIPRDRFAAERKSAADNRMEGEFAPMTGTPYGMVRRLFLSPNRLPCNAPPWGTLVAVNMTTGKKRWDVPLGVIPVPSGKGIDGSLHLGGPLATGGGLVFIAATLFDNKLRAFDSENGRVLWETELPAGGQSHPMTYQVKGKQYIVIAAGGHGKAGNKQGDYVVAFALP
jgi:quinoprotein glucose dehydrogenase